VARDTSEATFGYFPQPEPFDPANTLAAKKPTGEGCIEWIGEGGLSRMDELIQTPHGELRA
jgi:hypothetical protein